MGHYFLDTRYNKGQIPLKHFVVQKSHKPNSLIAFIFVLQFLHIMSEFNL